MWLKKYLYPVVLLLVSSAPGLAQGYFDNKRDMKVILSGGMGTATYYGELQNSMDLMDWSPSVSVGIQAFQFPNFMENRLSTRSELIYFRLHAADKNATNSRVVRNLSFHSDNVEVNSTLLLHLLPVSRNFRRRTYLNAYGFAGGGLLFMNPKTDYQGKAVALQPLHTEGVSYSRFQFVIPYGVGVKIFKSAVYNIALEAGWRKTFTDHLDDASSSGYPNPAILTSDLARALSDRRPEYYESIGDPRNPSYTEGVRGNPETKDSYMLVSIKLEYYLKSTVDNMYDKLMIIRVLKRKHRRTYH